MRSRFAQLLFSLAVLATVVAAQSEAGQPARFPFAGTWNAQMNDLPGIKLTMAETGEKVRGTVIFYFQERSGVNAPWHVAGQYESAILAPYVNGKTLTFEVQRHTCNGCAELGPNAHFRMTLTGPDEARIWRLEDDEDGPGFKLVREK